MISWGPTIERHIKGTSNEGNTVWWIRLDKNGKVIALYKIVGTKKVKHMPEDGIDETIEGMKLKAAILDETLAFAKKISKHESKS